MIIGIDARFYGPKQKGLGRYVQKLVNHLEKADLHNQYIIFLRKENWSEYEPTNPNFKKVLADCRWYGLKEQLLLPIKIRQHKIDLMHFPHFNIPVFSFVPFVVTIHDLVLKRFPTRRASQLGFLKYWLKNLAYRFVIWLSVSRSKKIITVSDYTKKDILNYFKVNPEKIEVIYEGKPDLKYAKTNAGQKLLQKLKIPQPYLLYVGNAYPHKNLERLILAFAEIRNQNCQLVLVGGLDYFYKKLKEFILSAKLSKRDLIVFTNFVSDEQLAYLYQKASLYVFPSLGEGFGLPPLEAIAYGTPVVSSRAGCLPEILSEAAVYFDPNNINEMAQKIEEVLQNESIRRDLIEKGKNLIKKYSWQKMALKTRDVYQREIMI